MEEVSITSKDNLKLKGYLIEENPNSNKYIVLIHGYTANMHIQMPLVRFFKKEGFNILMVDERSHGKSKGKFPSYGYYERQDIDLWIEFLKDRIPGKFLLGLHGQSMGAATALLVGAKNDSVDFIIEDCGYSSAKKVMQFQIKGKGNYMPYRLIYIGMRIMAKLRIHFDVRDVEPIEEIKDLDTPIMFVHGDSDTAVPYTMAYDMYNIRNNKDDVIFIVNNAEHMYCYSLKKEEYERKAHDFIRKVEEKLKK